MEPNMIAACCRTISEVEAGGAGTNLPWIAMPSYATWTDGTLARLAELLAGRIGTQVSVDLDDIEERLVKHYADHVVDGTIVTRAVSGRCSWPFGPSDWL